MTTERERGSGSADGAGEPTDARTGGAEPSGGTMRARRWCIAATFRDPADYGIPELPDWTVYRDEDGTLALGARGERFISAGRPVRVRR